MILIVIAGFVNMLKSRKMAAEKERIRRVGITGKVSGMEAANHVGAIRPTS